jgi:hypothetical protein
MSIAINAKGKVEVDTGELVKLIGATRNETGWLEVIRSGEITDIADALAAYHEPVRLKDDDCAMLTMICDYDWRYSIQALCWRCFSSPPRLPKGSELSG